MPERKLEHSRPPLPFMGSKMRWWRELEGLARSLPRGGCVFDAFGGSLSAARVIKDARPDLTVVTNDYEHVYRNRLDAAPQTASILTELQGFVPPQSGACFERLSPEVQERAVAIVETASDSQTAWSWLNKRSSIRNKVPTTACVDVERCEAWTDDLLVIDERLDEREARYVVNSGAFVMLDPPYYGKDQVSYSEGIDDAQAFTQAVIETGNNWCLFECPDSPLVQLAMPLATTIIPYSGKPGRMKVREIMLVRQWPPPEVEAPPVCSVSVPDYPQGVAQGIVYKCRCDAVEAIKKPPNLK